MPAEKTTHIAYVVSSDNFLADVRINSLSNDDCNGCMIASVCSLPTMTTLSDVISPEKKIPTGEKVIIEPIKSTPWNAIIITFLIPLIVVLALVVGLSYIGVAQWIQAVGALVFFSVYFLILYFLRKKLEEKLRWHIIEIIE